MRDPQRCLKADTRVTWIDDARTHAASVWTRRVSSPATVRRHASHPKQQWIIMSAALAVDLHVTPPSAKDLFVALCHHRAWRNDPHDRRVGGYPAIRR
jgi:hypothetical protein